MADPSQGNRIVDGQWKWLHREDSRMFYRSFATYVGLISCDLAI
jgi:hypothetical protein